jgi:hypothetical protein
LAVVANASAGAGAFTFKVKMGNRHVTQMKRQGPGYEEQDWLVTLTYLFTA